MPAIVSTMDFAGVPAYFRNVLARHAHDPGPVRMELTEVIVLAHGVNQHLLALSGRDGTISFQRFVTRPVRPGNRSAARMRQPRTGCVSGRARRDHLHSRVRQNGETC
jgi:hypothetical protein